MKGFETYMQYLEDEKTYNEIERILKDTSYFSFKVNEISFTITPHNKGETIHSRDIDTEILNAVARRLSGDVLKDVFDDLRKHQKYITNNRLVDSRKEFAAIIKSIDSTEYMIEREAEKERRKIAKKKKVKKDEKK